MPAAAGTKQPRLSPAAGTKRGRRIPLIDRAKRGLATQGGAPPCVGTVCSTRQGEGATRATAGKGGGQQRPPEAVIFVICHLYITGDDRRDGGTTRVAPRPEEAVTRSQQ
jgi:hypothetical protein